MGVCRYQSRADPFVSATSPRVVTHYAPLPASVKCVLKMFFLAKAALNGVMEPDVGSYTIKCGREADYPGLHRCCQSNECLRADPHPAQDNEKVGANTETRADFRTVISL